MAAALDRQFELVTLGDVRLCYYFETTCLALELLFQFTRVDVSSTHHSSKDNYEFAHLLSFYLSDVATDNVLNWRHIYQSNIDMFLDRPHLVRIVETVLHPFKNLVLA